MKATVKTHIQEKCIQTQDRKLKAVVTKQVRETSPNLRQKEGHSLDPSSIETSPSIKENEGHSDDVGSRERSRSTRMKATVMMQVQEKLRQTQD